MTRHTFVSTASAVSLLMLGEFWFGRGAIAQDLTFHKCTVCSVGCPFACPTSPSAPGSSSAPSSAGSMSSLQEAQLNLASQFGQALGTALGNWLRSSDEAAEARRKQEAEIARLKKEWEQAEARRKAEEHERQMQAMYLRLSKSLRRVGTPDELSLHRYGSDKGLSIRRSGAGPDMGTGDSSLPKSSSGSGPGYGIPGLPGVYVGGPSGSAPNLSASLTASTAAPVAKGDVQQAVQLIAAADKAPESVRGVLYDVAVNAAGGDKSVTQWLHADTNPPAVTDEQARGFQQTENAYREARAEQTSASQAVSQVSAQHDATQELVRTAKSDLDAAKAHLADPATLREKEQALADMMAAEKSQREGLQAARAALDKANTNLEQARTAAVSGLRGLSGMSDEAASERARGIFEGSASVVTSTNTVDLRDRTTDTPRLLRSPPANARLDIPKANSEVSLLDKPTIAETRHRLAALRHEVEKLQQAVEWLNKSASSTQSDRVEWMQISQATSREAMRTGIDLAADVAVYYTSEKLKKMLDEQTAEIRRAIDQLTGTTDPGHRERLQLAITTMDENRQAIKTAQREVKLADAANSADQLRHLDKDADKKDIEKALETTYTLMNQVLNNDRVQRALELGKQSEYMTFAKHLADAGYEVAAQGYSVWGVKETEKEMSTCLSTLKAVKERMETAEKNIRKVEAELQAVESSRAQ
jgi:hypothetical protein